jgi:class 3 adenylate cyclase
VTAETRFVRVGEVDLAYQVFGDGPVDLIGTFGWVSHLEAMWELPESARFLERLAGMARVVWFDKRGTGLSDRSSGTVPVEVLADDMVAILDDVGSERAVALGWLEAGATALALAARHPDRVQAVVAGETVAVGRSEDVPAIGLDCASIDAVAGWLEVGAWGQGAVLALAAPSLADEPRIRRWWQRLERTAATPSVAAHLLRTTLELDLRPFLDDVRAPVLLLHRRDVPLVPSEGMRWLAEQLPDARLVELEGTDLAAYFGDTDAVCDEIEEFLHGTRHGSAADLAVRTVVFLDLVGSTERAAALGDAAWCAVLDSHRQDVRRLLTRHGGVEVDTAGDGIFASFRSPSHAVRFAADAVADAAAQGTRLRVGVHTAEVEVRGSSMVGVGVHVGARVAALAGAGEVLVSSTVRDLVLGSGLAFASIGTHELRGVPGRWEILRLDDDRRGCSRPTPRLPRPPRACHRGRTCPDGEPAPREGR